MLFKKIVAKALGRTLILGAVGMIHCDAASAAGYTNCLLQPNHPFCRSGGGGSGGGGGPLLQPSCSYVSQVIGFDVDDLGSHPFYSCTTAEASQQAWMYAQVYQICASCGGTPQVTYRNGDLNYNCYGYDPGSDPDPNGGCYPNGSVRCQYTVTCQ